MNSTLPPETDTASSVTADDVAARAGVSRWTVTRAFKKDASISAKSCRKVMEAAEALGYVPDLLASSLASDRSNLVALLVDDFDNPHKLVMLERLTRILRANGWGTILVNMLSSDDGPSALLSASQRRVDAAVLIGTQFDDDIMRTALGARRLRKLIVFARTSVNPDTISIGCDDAAAMDEIADHLHDRGYRRPLFLAGPDTESTRLMRKDAFLRRWEELQGGMVPRVINVVHYNMQEAHDGLRNYLVALAPDAKPDVVVCENDVLALGAIDAIKVTLGLRVPQDIAVTGFDDIPLAASPSYQLTTYRQPIANMVKALATMLSDDEQSAESVVLAGKFVVRGTT